MFASKCRAKLFQYFISRAIYKYSNLRVPKLRANLNYSASRCQFLFFQSTLANCILHGRHLFSVWLFFIAKTQTEVELLDPETQPPDDLFT